MEYKLLNNEDKKQFELHVDEVIAKIEYIRTSNKIYLTHTEVPKILEGKGIGTKLVKKVLEYIKEKNLTLIPLCPFVAAYIKRNPEWREIVLKGINVK